MESPIFIETVPPQTHNIYKHKQSSKVSISLFFNNRDKVAKITFQRKQILLTWCIDGINVLSCGQFESMIRQISTLKGLMKIEINFSICFYNCAGHF